MQASNFYNAGVGVDQHRRSNSIFTDIYQSNVLTMDRFISRGSFSYGNESEEAMSETTHSDINPRKLKLFFRLSCQYATVCIQFILNMYF